MYVHLPRRICTHVASALSREWLVTNGLGGFASGTIAGALTRRYHGLLIAAVDVPVGRRLFVAKLDETLLVGKTKHQLYTNVWPDGVEKSPGCRYLQRFDLRLGVPTWAYAVGDVQLVKRIWMEHGQNITYVSYELSAASAPVTLAARLLANDRDYHFMHHGVDRRFKVDAEGGALTFRAEKGTPVHVTAHGGRRPNWRVAHTWCHNFELSEEAARGYDHREHHLIVGDCHVELRSGDAVTFALATDDASVVDVHGALARAEQRASRLLATWGRQAQATPARVPARITQLVLAADQFIVARPAIGDPDGHTVIAGYPWFTDWGRDTMISLPGLTLATGRHDLARQILLTWARHVDGGMIPNRFPDHGGGKEYHTADASLWYLWAIDQYVRYTHDRETLATLFPVMRDIIAAHRAGTRHNIRVYDDGLVFAGEHGVNLTWMDAKFEGHVVTPRIGKPIELSALWYDALCNMARLADLLDETGDEYVQLANTTRRWFSRYFRPERGYCADVLDGPNGDELLLRPNQIFAVALHHSPLPRAQQVAVVRACEERLLTWFGLRSLAPGERGYHGHYVGTLRERDHAYHMGTAWGWLLGPLAVAHYRVHKDAAHARELLDPLLGQLWATCAGQLAEVFNGDEPHTPGGCYAQAWSVATLLHAWHVTQQHA